jgi:DNA-binding transcriptional MerR regulator
MIKTIDIDVTSWFRLELEPAEKQIREFFGTPELSGGESMEYTINKLAKLSGVSTRTLRYYDEIGLLVPARVSSNGYRIYGQNEVVQLQQILFFREMDMPLADIKDVVTSADFDTVAALEGHLSALLAKQSRINLLIANVEKSISAVKGETMMSDNEKFEGFKQELLDENEQKYGKEIREKFGDDVIDKSNAKFKGMTKKQHAEIERLSEELNSTIKAAYEQGDPASELAQKMCELHKQWLMFFWPDGAYSSEAHKALAQGYVDDPRFTAYYDKIAVGCAIFLRDAISIYCG